MKKRGPAIQLGKERNGQQPLLEKPRECSVGGFEGSLGRGTAHERSVHVYQFYNNNVNIVNAFSW